VLFGPQTERKDDALEEKLLQIKIGGQFGDFVSAKVPAGDGVLRAAAVALPVESQGCGDPAPGIAGLIEHHAVGIVIGTEAVINPIAAKIAMQLEIELAEAVIVGEREIQAAAADVVPLAAGGGGDEAGIGEVNVGQVGVQRHMHPRLRAIARVEGIMEACIIRVVAVTVGPV